MTTPPASNWSALGFIDWSEIRWGRWTLLVGVAVIGSAIYGASLSAVLADWKAVASAQWLALSAGLAWCVFMPTLVWVGKVRVVPCVDACLLTMAVGEVVLTLGALLNAILWWRGATAHAVVINALVVAISNVAMAATLIRSLRPQRIPAARVFVVWMLALNGSGAVFFSVFHRWLHGA